MKIKNPHQQPAVIGIAACLEAYDNAGGGMPLEQDLLPEIAAVIGQEMNIDTERAKQAIVEARTNRDFDKPLNYAAVTPEVQEASVKGAIIVLEAMRRQGSHKNTLVATVSRTVLKLSRYFQAETSTIRKILKQSLPETLSDIRSELKN